MINHIKINNFKSLIGFELTLLKGLNVLVGPNGSGKTNIISFFEFLSFMLNDNLWKAVSEMGGAGAIFTKSSKGYEKRLTAEIFGCLPMGSSTKITYPYYRYFIEISNQPGAPVCFENQVLYIKILNKYSDYIFTAGDTDWDLLVRQTNDDNNVSVKIDKLNPDTLKDYFYMPLSSKDSQMSYLETLFTQSTDQFTSILNTLKTMMHLAHFIAQDMVGGRAFNIVPTRVKSPEDAGTPFGISKDGTGLASTLYNIKVGGSVLTRRMNRVQATLDSILGSIKVANKSICELKVINDPYDNKLRVTLTIDCGDHKAELPLSALSDGTVKWMAIVVALETSETIFSIEEPENYMHPHMQSTAIEIIRSSLERKSFMSTLLLSTHSETILNSTKPEEIIVVSFEAGRTKVTRPKNVKAIAEQVQKTGFGLGYFYLAGVLNV